MDHYAVAHDAIGRNSARRRLRKMSDAIAQVLQRNPIKQRMSSGLTEVLLRLRGAMIELLRLFARRFGRATGNHSDQIFGFLACCPPAASAWTAASVLATFSTGLMPPNVAATLPSGVTTKVVRSANP